MLDNLKLGRQISIHALRGEGDNSGSYACGGDKYFNPRPPWGGRRVPHDILVLTARTISIHALRGEGDDYSEGVDRWLRNFNPRPPWGGRPYVHRASRSYHLYFNPRPPWGGRL